MLVCFAGVAVKMMVAAGVPGVTDANLAGFVAAVAPVVFVAVVAVGFYCCCCCCSSHRG